MYMTRHQHQHPHQQPVRKPGATPSTAIELESSAYSADHSDVSDDDAASTSADCPVDCPALPAQQTPQRVGTTVAAGGDAISVQSEHGSDPDDGTSVTSDLADDNDINGDGNDSDGLGALYAEKAALLGEDGSQSQEPPTHSEAPQESQESQEPHISHEPGGQEEPDERSILTQPTRYVEDEGVTATNPSAVKAFSQEMLTCLMVHRQHRGHFESLPAFLNTVCIVHNFGVYQEPKR